MKTAVKIINLSFVIVALAAGLCLAGKGETTLASTSGIQARPEKADYWITRHPEPDRIILTPDGIEAMNRAALGRPETELVDLFSILDPAEGNAVRTTISDVLAESRQSKGYDHTNRIIAPAFYDRIEAAIGDVPSVIQPAWGIITARTSLRRFPTNEAFYDKPFGNEFDRFQYSTLECGDPIVVLHRTLDSTWSFIQTTYTMGWVPSASVAIGDHKTVLAFSRSSPLVATGSMIPVYTDPAFAVHAVSIPMGTKLPFVEQKDRYYSVTLPWRAPDGSLKFTTGYLKPDADVHVGFLPYTARNFYQQVFKLVGQAYGWGDLFDGRDCSRLVMDVFSAFGFNMPRNSRRQASFNPAGQKDTEGLAEKDKLGILKSLEGWPALLYMPGHIMIYLGTIDGRVYAIHSAWSWRESRIIGKRTVMAGRVVVSDIARGTGSRGSLLKRVTAVIPLGGR